MRGIDRGGWQTFDGRKFEGVHGGLREEERREGRVRGAEFDGWDENYLCAGGDESSGDGF